MASDNMDPEGTKSDAELNDALNLIYTSSAASKSIRDKFRLDTEVHTDGANFSAGEKQLMSLLRALIRGCKVLILDEATSSVDPETDSLIQRIIQTQLKDVTVSLPFGHACGRGRSCSRSSCMTVARADFQLLSIAHRLQTVAYYDRILVMDAGSVVEVGPPRRYSLYTYPESILLTFSLTPLSACLTTPRPFSGSYATSSGSGEMSFCAFKRRLPILVDLPMQEWASRRLRWRDGAHPMLCRP